MALQRMTVTDPPVYPQSLTIFASYPEPVSAQDDTTYIQRSIMQLHNGQIDNLWSQIVF